MGPVARVKSDTRIFLSGEVCYAVKAFIEEFRLNKQSRPRKSSFFNTSNCLWAFPQKRRNVLRYCPVSHHTDKGILIY